MAGIDRRTKVYRDILQRMPKSDSLIHETLDGEEYRYKPERRCRVCSAGEASKNLKNGTLVKNIVDEMTLYPKTLAEIHRIIEPMMEEWPSELRISYKSIRTHQKKHLPFDKVAARAMVEKWAQQQGISVIDAAGRMLLTEEAWLELTAEKGWQRLVHGDIEPSWVETQKAFERISDLKRQAEGEYSTVTILAQVNAIIEAVREVVPQEMYAAIIEKIENREKLAELPDIIEPLALEPDVEAEDLFNSLVSDQDEERFDE
jgi:hypothetical protein